MGRVPIFDYFWKKDGDGEAQSEARREPTFRELMNRFARNVAEDKRRYPEYMEAIDTFYENLKAKYKSESAARNAGRLPPLSAAEVTLFLTPDRMYAYACLFPPPAGGAEVSVEELLEDMRYEGITYGVLKDDIAAHIGRKDYLHIFPIAVGTMPVDGTDAEITELFPRRANTSLEVGDEDTINFSALDCVQFVRAGDVLCEIEPPMPGSNGTDVTGQTLPCQSGEQIPIPSGQNTRLSEDGKTLVAALDGILYTEDGLFCVRKQKFFSGDLDGRENVVCIDGDLYLPGSVYGGTNVEASGDVIINGEVRDATVTSTAGSIRVQEGIHGVEGKTFLKAARQIQTPVIENAAVVANGSVIAEVISNSSVRSARTVSALGGHGLIVGGRITAKHRIVCQRIGSISGAYTLVTVGSDPQLLTAWEENQEETAQTQSVIDKLWASIGDLRRSVHLTEEQKELLSTLTEQRRLYEEQRTTLKEQKEALRQQLRAAEAGRIRCQELYPGVEIQIGERRAEVKNMEVDCDIRLRGSEIYLR